MPEVSVIVPARDAEGWVAMAVRQAARIQQVVERNFGRTVEFEILVLDERSGDNTLSVLSVLHGQIANLRTVQDLEPGTALRRASRLARADAWLVVDHPVDAELAAWAIGQVLRGHRAALVDGELLAVDRTTGAATLGRGGGLACAQSSVVRYLRKRGDRPVRSPRSDARRLARVIWFLRKSVATLGFGRLDAPTFLRTRPSRSTAGDGLL
jgi:glycosyltransferase involved in cell wall biosynthesis